jgi:hypothetical protein
MSYHYTAISRVAACRVVGLWPFYYPLGHPMPYGPENHQNSKSDAFMKSGPMKIWWGLDSELFPFLFPVMNRWPQKYLGLWNDMVTDMTGLLGWLDYWDELDFFISFNFYLSLNLSYGMISLWQCLFRCEEHLYKRLRRLVRRLVGPHDAITWKREYVETRLFREEEEEEETDYIAIPLRRVLRT